MGSFAPASLVVTVFLPLLLLMMIGQASGDSWSGARLSQPRYQLSATSAGDRKVLFAAGLNGPVLQSDSGVDVVDIYDVYLNSWKTARLSQVRTSIAATSIGDLAFFAGGVQGYRASTVVDVYNAATDRWSRTHLPQAVYDSTATSVGGQVLITSYQWVNIYTVAADRWTTHMLSMDHSLGMVATTVGNLAMFAGGSSQSRASALVDIYDAASGRWRTAELSEARYRLAATSVGNLALFAGGTAYGEFTGTRFFSVVDIYDASSDEWYTATLSQARADLVATTVGDLAIFAGGETEDKTWATVDIYNASSNQWSTARLSQARTSLAATSVGSLAFFAGGLSYLRGYPSAVVDIFEASAVSPFPSLTPSVSPTRSATPSLTPSVSPTISSTPSVSPTISITPSFTPSMSPTTSATPSTTPSPSSSPSVSPTISTTPSNSPTTSATPSTTPSPSPSPSPIYKKDDSTIDKQLALGLGIGLGSLVLLIGSASATYYCYFRRRRRRTLLYQPITDTSAL